MFSGQITKRTLPLPLRLTLWYAIIFTVSSLVALSIIYFSIASVVQNRTDNELIDEIEEISTIWKHGGIKRLNSELDEEIQTEDNQSMFIRVMTSDGKVIRTSDLSHWHELQPSDDIAHLNNTTDEPLLETKKFTQHEFPTRIIYQHLGTELILQMGVSLEEDKEFLSTFRQVIAITLPLITFIAAFLGWFMARKALQGVRDVTTAAIDITKGDLNRRVLETGGSDEIDQLAITFNLMLERIQILVNSMQDMNDNIAHDLRSPLTRIRGAAETMLMNNPSIDDFTAVAGDTIEECDRLLHMINTMLDITESEAGTSAQIIEAVNMTSLVTDACDLMRPLAEDKDIALKCSSTNNVIVSGNVPQLQRLVGNLLENALKYTLKGGQVTLDLHPENNQVIIDIIDNGIGIDEADIGDIFTRFYRSDQSRSEPGSGLGLSLALAIAHVHGGDIRVSSELGKGSHFSIVLPLRSE